MSKQIPDGWGKKKIGELLSESRIPASNPDPSKRLTVRLHLEGVEKREERITDQKKATTYFKRKAGQFIYGKQNLHKGALGIVPSEFDGFQSSQDIPAFDVDEIVDVRWFFYYFARPHFYKNLEFLSTGTGSKRIHPKELYALPILLPSLHEQQKITAILGSVDRTIEKTRSVIDQTRSLKKAMMQELLTRGIPGRHKRFKKTPIGEIPEDWKAVKLVEILREPIKNGYSPNCPDQPTGHWMLGLGAVTFEGINPSAVKAAPNNDEKIHDFVLENGDVLVSRSNTRERVGLAGTYKGNPANCSYPDLLMRLRARTDIVSPLWVEKCLLSNKGRTYFEREARGTSASMVKINKAILNSFPLALPLYEEQKNILKYLSKIEKCMEEELSTLKQFNLLKTALMQVLLTGKVRVKT